ncbi:MAG: hypothetical protein JHC30_05975 [Caldisericum sp.]|nr:hypothetical protein [Caldisericum sp.]
MCVISVSLKGKKFSEKVLKKMWNSNPHGAGVAWIEGSKVRVVKGLMRFDDLVEVYRSIPDVMHAIHFRWRSTGDVLPQLTHPFRVDSIDMQELRYTAEAVLFHNGTVPYWRNLYVLVLSVLRKKDREKILSLEAVSDTYVVSLLVNRFGSKILKHLDVASRWLIFAAEPIFYGIWSEDKKNGFKFSNVYWKYGYKGFLHRWEGRDCCNGDCSQK